MRIFLLQQGTRKALTRIQRALLRKRHGRSGQETTDVDGSSDLSWIRLWARLRFQEIQSVVDLGHYGNKNAGPSECGRILNQCGPRPIQQKVGFVPKRHCQLRIQDAPLSRVSRKDFNTDREHESPEDPPRSDLSDTGRQVRRDGRALRRSVSTPTTEHDKQDKRRRGAITEARKVWELAKLLGISSVEKEETIISKSGDMVEDSQGEGVERQRFRGERSGGCPESLI
ncbi:hypothetical protein Dimus_009496 [Dionaea muscipula]